MPYGHKITGVHQCGFKYILSTTDQIFGICQILDKKWEYNGTVHQVFIDFKNAYDSGRREVSYNILIQFSMPVKLATLITVCLNETYSTVHRGKHTSDAFSSHNGLKQGDALSPLLFNFCYQECPRTQREWKWMGHSSFCVMLMILIYWVKE
jgi:hypothetical protein